MSNTEWPKITASDLPSLLGKMILCTRSLVGSAANPWFIPGKLYEVIKDSNRLYSGTVEVVGEGGEKYACHVDHSLSCFTFSQFQKQWQQENNDNTTGVDISLGNRLLGEKLLCIKTREVCGRVTLTKDSQYVVQSLDGNLVDLGKVRISVVDNLGERLTFGYSEINEWFTCVEEPKQKEKEPSITFDGVDISTLRVGYRLLCIKSLICKNEKLLSLTRGTHYIVRSIKDQPHSEPTSVLIINDLGEHHSFPYPEINEWFTNYNDKNIKKLSAPVVAEVPNLDMMLGTPDRMLPAERAMYVAHQAKIEEEQKAAGWLNMASEIENQAHEGSSGNEHTWALRDQYRMMTGS